MISYSYGFTIEKSDIPEDLKLIVTPSSGAYGAGPVTTGRFMCTLTSTEEEITELSVACPGASNIMTDRVNKYFVITLSDNATTSDKSYTATVYAGTTSSYSLQTTVLLTQTPTYLTLSKSNLDISYVAANYKITGVGSNNLDDVVFAIPSEARSWISNMKLSVSDEGVATISFDATENTGTATRVANIGVTVVKSGVSLINRSFTISQSVKSDISPIWKDYV